MSMMVDFQTYAGPGDKALRNTEIEGYQPVSRIGEVVMNAFVDSYEYTSEAMNDQITPSSDPRYRVTTRLRVRK